MLAEAVAAAASELTLRDDVLARLGGPFGDAVREAARELAALAPPAQRQRRAVWGAAVRAPTPPGLRGVHPSWIEAALERLPVRARRDLASGGADPVGVWLVRVACATAPCMPPMAPIQLVESVGDLDAALSLSAVSLVTWLENVGAEQLAVLAICSKTVELVQRRVGPAGDRIRAALVRVWPFFRKDLLGYPLAQIAKRCANTPLEDHGLVRIGARTIAPHVSPAASRHPFAAEALALRLPRDLGAIVLGELRAYANVPVAQAPSWRVLAHVSVVPA